MKKHLLTLALSFFAVAGFAQTNGYLRGDTVRITNKTKTAVFIIENASKNTAGFAKNGGSGKLVYSAIHVSDIVGIIDTINAHASGGDLAAAKFYADSLDAHNIHAGSPTADSLNNNEQVLTNGYDFAISDTGARVNFNINTNSKQINATTTDGNNTASWGLDGTGSGLSLSARDSTSAQSEAYFTTHSLIIQHTPTPGVMQQIEMNDGNSGIIITDDLDHKGMRYDMTGIDTSLYTVESIPNVEWVLNRIASYSGGGGGSFIQNQNASPQTANSYITGEYKSRYFGYEGTFSGSSLYLVHPADSIFTTFGVGTIAIGRADTTGRVYYEMDLGSPLHDTVYVTGSIPEVHYNRLMDTVSAATDYDVINKKYADAHYSGTLGFTPVTNARTLTINGSTLDLSANRSWTITPLNTDTTSTGFATKAALIPYLTKAQIIAAYQPSLGFTAENVANKTATASASTTTYPNWQGVQNYVTGLGYLSSIDTTTMAKGRSQANTQLSQLATRATTDEGNISTNTSSIAALPTKNATYQLNGIPYINSSAALQTDTTYLSYNPSTHQVKYHAGTTGTNVEFKIGSGLTTDKYNVLGVSEALTVAAGDVASMINAEGRYTMSANSSAADRYRGGKFVALVDPGGFTSTGIGTGVLGIEGVSRINGAGTVNVATGVYGRVLIDLTGATINTANDYLAPAPSVVTGGLIVNAIGYNAVDQAATRVTNSFNYVSGGTNSTNGGQGPSDGATGAWSFYGYSTAPNFFAGKTGIGPGMGVSTSNITAYLQLGAGTTAANTAPLKFTSGTHLTTGEDGAMNYDGTNLTVDIGTTKNTLATDLNTMVFNSAKTWNGQVIAGLYGGTGVANSGKTLTLAGNLQLFGGFNATLTVTGSTNVTLPPSGTLATLASPIFTGTPGAPTATPYTNSTVLATTAYVDKNIVILSTTSGINAKTIAANTVFTVPVGKNCIITRCDIVPSTSTSATVGPTADLYSVTAGDIFASTANQAITAGTYFTFPLAPPSNIGKLALSGTTIKYNITTGATATTLTYTVVLWGYLF